MTQTASPVTKIARDGLMPMIGFGTWQLTGSGCYDAVRTALDVGYRHIDTATVYRNEEEVGRALRDSGIPRDEVFVTTKVPGGEPDPLRTLDASRRALRVDHVDLWLVHWPEGGVREDLWRACVEAREIGRTTAIGVSNYSLEQIDALTAEVRVTPAVNQISWAPSKYDAAVENGHRERGVVLEGYSPFKNTDLDDPVLREIAEAHGVSTAQVVLRWHLDHGVVVIPKSATPERIRSNFAVTGFSLGDEEVERIDGLAKS